MAKNITYRKIGADDFEELFQFHMDVYCADEPLAKIWGISDSIKHDQTLENVFYAIQDNLSFVAVDSMKIIGMTTASKKSMSYSKTLDKNAAHMLFGDSQMYPENVVMLDTLAVHRSYRKKGIARRLIQLVQIESWLQGYQWLLVDTADTFVRKLLDDLDFVQYKVRNIEDVTMSGKRMEVKSPDELNKTYSNHGKKLVVVVNMELIEDILANL